MSSLRRLTTTTAAATTTRSFSTTTSHQASILFALGALSNSRETQHLNKLSRLERIEHSPSLKLIKTSEVDPYPLPEPVKAPTVLLGHVRSPTKMWDARALAVGKRVLSENARRTFRLEKALEKAKRREVTSQMSRSREVASWAMEREKMRGEVRAAGVWIFLAVGVATGLGMWRFWPADGVRDSGEMGRKIAEKARGAMTLPGLASAQGMVSAAVASPPIGVMGPSTTTKKKVVGESVETPVVESGSTWRSLLWKQQ